MLLLVLVKCLVSFFFIHNLNCIKYSLNLLGGAISQAKGAFSNWWSNLLVSPEPVQKGVEAVQEIDTEDDSLANKTNSKCDLNNETTLTDIENNDEGEKFKNIHTNDKYKIGSVNTV